MAVIRISRGLYHQCSALLFLKSWHAKPSNGSTSLHVVARVTLPQAEPGAGTSLPPVSLASGPRRELSHCKSDRCDRVPLAFTEV